MPSGLVGALLGMGNPLLDISAVVDQAFLDKYEVSYARALNFSMMVDLKLIEWMVTAMMRSVFVRVRRVVCVCEEVCVCFGEARRSGTPP